MNNIVKKSDARNRALRTFLQGLAVDTSIVIALVLYNATSSNDFSFNGTYWAGVGVLLARNVIHSAASYVMRYFKAPPTE
jgi:hypothetical protein